jgi:hypothetical protein
VRNPSHRPSELKVISWEGARRGEGGIELLDDMLRGMWAELLNERGFEGFVPPANWAYYDGSPTLSDRVSIRAQTGSPVKRLML